MTQFLAHLKKLAPVARAGLTSCVVMQAGDVLCQTIQQHQNKASAYDWERTARFGLIGLTLHGPMFYHSFRTLDSRLGLAKDFLTAAKKASINHLCVFSAYVAGFFIYVTLLETRGDFEAAKEKLRSSFVKTYAVGSLFWPAANIVNFMFVPPTGRILYVNVAGLFWNAVLSELNNPAEEL